MKFTGTSDLILSYTNKPDSEEKCGPQTCPCERAPCDQPPTLFFRGASVVPGALYFDLYTDVYADDELKSFTSALSRRQAWRPNQETVRHAAWTLAPELAWTSLIKYQRSGPMFLTRHIQTKHDSSKCFSYEDSRA